MCRASIFIAAEGATEDDEQAVSLALHTLAWGSGAVLKLNRVRIEALARGWHEPGRPRIAALRAALAIGATDPASAYDMCRPGGDACISHIGPSFFTKMLYFAGEGMPDHPSLILDFFVAAALREVGGWTEFGRTGGWSAGTYAKYLELIRRWSQEASATLDVDIAPDEIEYELSRAARGRWDGVPAAW
jgi:hypothetical protein